MIKFSIREIEKELRKEMSRSEAKRFVSNLHKSKAFQARDEQKVSTGPDDQADMMLRKNPGFLGWLKNLAKR